METKLRFARDFAWPIGISTFGAAWVAYGFMSAAYDLYTAGLTDWGWNLIGLAILLIGFIVALYTVASRQSAATSVSVEPPQHTSPPPNISGGSAATRNYFQNEEIAVWDLVVRGESLIEDKVFRDCVLYGPAVIAILDGVHIDGLSLEGPPDAVLIQVEEGRWVIGAVGLQRCKFDRCKFKQIGIIGPQKTMDMLRRALAGENVSG